MAQEVEAAFVEMLDISTDIDKAVLVGPAGVLASNMSEEAREAAVGQVRELARLGDARAAEMGSQPLTQLVVETAAGFVFFSREVGPDGLMMLATGKRGGRVGLVLYDLRTCIRDAREVISTKISGDPGTREG